jgi:hypothetical protein
MTLQSFTRWQAFALHLLLSALVATSVVVLVVWLWYPEPYFAAMGGAVLLRLLIGVDVMLGPLITLMIFDPKKPSLRVDLAVIAALQVAALAYGGWVMFQARPVYTVFANDQFHTVPANAIDAGSLARARDEYRSLPLAGPRLVSARMPDDPQETVRIVLEATTGGADLPDLPHLYGPIEQAQADIVRTARPLVSLAQQGKEAADLVGSFVALHGGSRSLGYLPVRARNRDFAAGVDRANGEVVGYLAISP